MSSSERSEGTPTTAHSTTAGCDAMASSTSAGERFSPRRRSTSFLRAHERVDAVLVAGDQIAGVQPAVRGDGGCRLLRHALVAGGDGRVAHQQLADFACSHGVSGVARRPCASLTTPRVGCWRIVPSVP